MNSDFFNKEPFENRDSINDDSFTETDFLRFSKSDNEAGDRQEGGLRTLQLEGSPLLIAL